MHGMCSVGRSAQEGADQRSARDTKEKRAAQKIRREKHETISIKTKYYNIASIYNLQNIALRGQSI
jgi:hypothetical protein